MPSRRWSHVHLGKIPPNSCVGKYSSGQAEKVKGIGFLQQEPGVLLGKLEPSRAKYPLPAHLRAQGHREDCSSKAKHHFLWIREGDTHDNMKLLESVSISLHAISRMRGDVSWLPPGPSLRAFHCLNLYTSTVLLTITVRSYWEAPETTMSGSNFIPVFHGRTPRLSGNHGILSVSQRNRQIQDTSSAAVNGQLLWTAAFSTSKPQMLRKCLVLGYNFNNEYWSYKAEKASSILRGCNNPTCGCSQPALLHPTLEHKNGKQKWPACDVTWYGTRFCLSWVTRWKKEKSGLETAKN